MNQVNFTHNGGMPFTQNVAAFMQATYTDGFAALAALLGNNTIVSGVQVAGGNVSAGWVIINGELLPFEAGPLGPAVEIVETPSSRVYNDTVSRQVYTVRKARCAAVGVITFDALATAGVVPKGAIMMWSGAVNAIPRGWALCDGTNGTPPLSGRFIVGYQSDDTDYDAIGKIGGVKQVTLTPEQLPAHRHGYNVKTGGNAIDHNSGTTVAGGSTAGPSTLQDTEPAGSNEPHENRPPYYVLAYIIKL